ncbi:MAG: aminoacyl-tRNA hydrolase [Bacteroidetes bacterium]|nr:aminoacyl-tRNA hydrolase [Bacteroidota bacterium]MBK9673078.1 aminoacyl-tRNA hydrolase [Bacteroidota bacterium]MBK9799630.1 aminoacyl-tRNA hydrolase [Bacteroidota bacterium]MBP6412355.1 aminoacyl-tRNA hydrolase [Bacteroidia bacterium]
MTLATRDFSGEFIFKATRSSGKGGQHVNKVASKIELLFYPNESTLLTSSEKTIALEKWKTKLSAEGCLRIVCQEDRSQLKNKEIAIRKFYTLLKRTLQKPKKRIAVTLSEADKEVRIKEKKIRGTKKALRQKPSIE